VVAGRHVEELDKTAIVAARALESLSDDRLEILACHVARHEWAIDRGPERLAAGDHRGEQDLGVRDRGRGSRAGCRFLHAELVAEVARLDDPTAMAYDDPLDDVAKFADVARPRIC